MFICGYLVTLGESLLSSALSLSFMWGLTLLLLMQWDVALNIRINFEHIWRPSNKYSVCCVNFHAERTKNVYVHFTKWQRRVTAKGRKKPTQRPKNRWENESDEKKKILKLQLINVLEKQYVYHIRNNCHAFLLEEMWNSPLSVNSLSPCDTLKSIWFWIR